MATFDLEQQKIVARIVYDGVAHAGKTTNVRRLGDLFTGVRRSEMVIPEERDGRTLWFDWVQLEGGMVCGLPLSCQIVTVPGQKALSHRRRHLLRTADAVVYVVDSSRRRLRRTCDGIELLRGILDERGVNRPPLVLQANKQDAPDALAPEALLAALAVSRTTPAIPARAHEGVGVRETLIRAVRALTDHIQGLSDEIGLQLAVRPAESARELHWAMIEDDIEDDFEEDTELRLVSELEDPAEAPTIPAATRPVLVVHVPPPVAAVPPPPLPPPLPLPPLPRSDARTGYVWPALTARDVLRDLETTEAALRAESPDRVWPTVADELGLACPVGNFWVRVSARRYGEVEEARTELIRLARGKSLIGAAQLPGTVLALQRDEEGAWRLWTVHRIVRTLENALDEATRRNDDPGVARVLDHYARVLVDAIVLASREHLILSLSLGQYALVHERTYYAGSDIGFGSGLPGLGEALAQPFERAPRHPDACAVYVERLETGLRTRLSSVDLERAGVVRALSEPRATGATRAAFDRLLRGLEPTRRNGAAIVVSQ